MNLLSNVFKHYYPFKLLALLILFMGSSIDAFSQTELMPWGNITGIRKQGQLFEFETSLKVLDASGSHPSTTAKERQRPHFSRSVNDQIVNTSIDSIFFKETVTDAGTGVANVNISVSTHADTTLSGIYFCVALPFGDYNGGQFRLLGTKNNSFQNLIGADGKEFKEPVKGIEFISSTRKLELKFEEPVSIFFKRDGGGINKNLQLYIVLKQNSIKKSEVVQKSFTIKASGNIDKEPVTLALNTSLQGRVFDGLGGNFRLQNPKTDQQVIDYSLRNLRVAWGRVELPWALWQPNKEDDPVGLANAGKLSPAVKKAMQMAYKLDSLGAPVILSAWFPPKWAIVGDRNFTPVKGVWGNPLNKSNIAAIYKSIADYILYLKSKYGVEVKLFSFNESDLGINIRLTAQEHDAFIKGCGAYFAGHGLKTKLLLGDNSDATTFSFINAAMNDDTAKPYIGAISFHSWRGWDANTLKKWADAATKLDVPLIIGEGSTDAAAYSYPDIFQEESYALQEINLYTRLLAICQPISILQWQLTADYSPLIGGGIFGNKEPLHPGQRFYNLKQLSITPKGLFAMPISCNRPNISCAALGDNDRGVYAIHIVNNGATREVTLTDIPAVVTNFCIYTTNKSGLKQGKSIKVTNGIAKFKLKESGFTTLISE